MLIALDGRLSTLSGRMRPSESDAQPTELTGQRLCYFSGAEYYPAVQSCVTGWLQAVPGSPSSQ